MKAKPISVVLLAFVFVLGPFSAVCFSEEVPGSLAPLANRALESTDGLATDMVDWIANMFGYLHAGHKPPTVKFFGMQRDARWAQLHESPDGVP